MALRDVRVPAPCGAVRGVRHDDGIAVFRGIPYAAPPVADRRFAPPAPPSRWTGTLDATAYGPVSLQDMDPLPGAVPGSEHNFYALDVNASEDCLTLNVWTPDVDGCHPVLFYIHGGAFLYGSSTGAWIDGSRFAREHGVVVVNVNYRLGLLGGLFLGDYNPAAANLGLQDQIAALNWVRHNISAFGGDPARVTIGGQSAGAMSAAGLLCAPAADGLFARALIISGHLDACPDLRAARHATAQILDCLHVDADGPDVIGALRQVSLFRIAAVQREFGIAIRAFPLVLDGVSVVSDPLAAIRAGRVRNIDLMIGTCAEEDRLFGITGWAAEAQSLADAVSELIPDTETRDRAVAFYASVDEPADRMAQIVATHHGWTEPARELARAQADAGGRVHHYEFAWRSMALQGRVGAAHLVDLPFVFGNLDSPGVSDLLGEEVRTDAATISLGEAENACVAQFVGTGKLDECALGSWPPFTRADPVTMVFDRQSAIHRDWHGPILDFWTEQRGHSAAPLSTLTTALAAPEERVGAIPL